MNVDDIRKKRSLALVIKELMDDCELLTYETEYPTGDVYMHLENEEGIQIHIELKD